GLDAIGLGFVAPPRDWLAVRRLEAEAREVLHRSAGRVGAGHPLWKPEGKFAGLHRYLFTVVKEFARDFAGIHFQAHCERALRGRGGLGTSNQTKGQTAEEVSRYVARLCRFMARCSALVRNRLF